jgi:hypothetical protein
MPDACRLSPVACRLSPYIIPAEFWQNRTILYFWRVIIAGTYMLMTITGSKMAL